MKRKHISFIMPFIDFAFMVIIIFVALLSIAYFEPPGSGGKEIKIKPLQKETVNKEKLIPATAKTLIPKAKNFPKKITGNKTTKEVKKLKNIIYKQQEQIKLLSVKISKLKQSAKIKTIIKISPANNNPAQPSVGKHLYTDLRNY